MSFGKQFRRANIAFYKGDGRTIEKARERKIGEEIGLWEISRKGGETGNPLTNLSTEFELQD